MTIFHQTTTKIKRIIKTHTLKHIKFTWLGRVQVHFTAVLDTSKQPEHTCKLPEMSDWLVYRLW